MATLAASWVGTTTKLATLPALPTLPRWPACSSNDLNQYEKKALLGNLLL
jgi:hypothetical protein